MKHDLISSLLLASSLMAGTQAMAADSCCNAPTTDFPKVGGNLGNQNYTRARPDQQEQHQAARRGVGQQPRRRRQVGQRQSTAVAVDGVLYIETAQGRVIAVDGKTGAMKWSYNPGRGGQTRRGVAVGEGKVYTLTTGNYVIALDQETGTVVWERAAQRRTATSPRWRSSTTTACSTSAPTTATAAPALALERHQRRPGVELLGRAAPGHLGGDTWEGDDLARPAARRRGSTRPSTPSSDTLYWTFGNVRAGSSQNGSTRGGQNLFANSIVAMDAKTGVYKWHFQSIHHDIWDMDNVMAPVLADVHDQRRHAQGRRLRQQDRHVLHPRPRQRLAAARHRRGAGAGRCRARRARRRSRSRARALDQLHPDLLRPIQRPGARGAQLPARLHLRRALGRARSCPSPATAAAPTGTTSRSASAPSCMYTGVGYVGCGAFAHRGQQRPASARRRRCRAASWRSIPRTNSVRLAQGPAAGRWRTATAS